jgi:hypothetical protein
MASILSAGTTSATAMVHTADTSGVLQLATNNGTAAVTIDTSQQVGIGATPATWGQSKAIQIGAAGAFSGQTSSKTAEMTSNGYLNSGWKYFTSGAPATLYYQYNGAHTFNSTSTSGTAGNAITWDAGTTLNQYGIGVGGAIPSSGTGIAFPATQSASSDANTLDDYEEGNFTPGVTFSGGTTGLTYASQNGSYVKIGRFVYASFNLQLSNKGSSSGPVQVTGLPFTVSSSVGFGICTANTFSLNSTIQTVLQITNGGTVMDLKFGGTDSNLANTDFTNSTQIRATVVYTSA